MAYQVAAMVDLQLLTGYWPGEIMALRPGDVTTSASDLWLYHPASHETEHRGREGRIYMGPQAQNVLGPSYHRRRSGCVTRFAQPAGR